MTARGQQSPGFAMRKPFSPTSLMTLNNHQDHVTNGPQDAYGQKIKVLRMSSQDTLDRTYSAPMGNTSNNMQVLGLNNGKTVIALVSKNTSNTGVPSTNAESSGTIRGGAGMQVITSRIQSPRSSAVNLVQRSPAMYRLSRFASN
jgi:hypothetical protein